MKNIGLVLEGGGMRSPYTSAVLDYFLEQDFHVPYVIGASAGAFNAIGYVAKQIGWSNASVMAMIANKDLKSFKNILHGKTYLDIDWVFVNFIAKQWNFDFETYMSSPQECVLTTFDCRDGSSMYHKKHDGIDALTLSKASSSLPFLAPIYYLNGVPCLDGGMSDSMPVRQSEKDGNIKNIVISTKSLDFVRKPDRSAFFAPLFYPKYPAIHKMLKTRHIKYNEDMAYIAAREKEGKAFLIRPSRPHGVGRMTTDPKLLSDLYALGKEDAANIFEELKKWVEE